MNDHPDHILDDQLRNVPVPPGIDARSALEPLFEAAAIDRLLVRVALPAGLEDRVRRLAAATGTGLLSLRPTGVPERSPLAAAHPDSSGRTPGRVGWSSASRHRWLAACTDLAKDLGAVMAALAIVASMFFAGMGLSGRLAAPGQTAVGAAVPVARGITRADAGEAPGVGRLSHGRVAMDAAGQRSGAAETHQSEAGGATGGGKRGLQEPHSPDGIGGLAAADVTVAAESPGLGETGVAVLAAPAFSGPNDARRGIGASGMRVVMLPLIGRVVPRVPGFDIAFEMAHGESPFIDPSLHPALAVDHPPLSMRTDSFDSLQESALMGLRDRARAVKRRPQQGGMPAVQVEDIFAALPAPPRPTETSGSPAGSRPAGSGAEHPGPVVDVSITAVRSLRPVVGSLLVEVCVAASPLAEGVTGSAGAEPLDAMLVLDQSVGPSSTLSWQWLCRGLGQVIGQLRPADRLSVVVCGEQPRLVALRADAEQLRPLVAELQREPPSRSADFDAVFRMIAAVGRREGLPRTVVVVAHSDSVERCRREGRDALVAWLAGVAGASSVPGALPTEFVLMDAQEPRHDRHAGHARHVFMARQRPSVSPSGRIAIDPVAISRAMVEKILGRPTLAATGCRLEVAFDPRRVECYRLIGHRQSAADAVSNVEASPIDMHAGEAVRVVYEVKRRANGDSTSGAGLVSAIFRWTPAGSDVEHRAVASLGGDALAYAKDRPSPSDPFPGLPSPHGCELLLAAGLGELAGASAHAEPPRQTAAAVALLAERWRARGDVTPAGELLMECLEQRGLSRDMPGP